MTGIVTSVPAAEMAEVVLKALEGADQSLTVSQLKRKLPKRFQREEELRRSVEELASQGRAYRCPPYRGRSPRYWGRNMEGHVRSVIIQVLQTGAITQSELLKRAKRGTKNFSGSRLKDLLKTMLVEGQIRKLPPPYGASRHLLGLGEARPGDYLRPVFKRVLTALTALGPKLETEGIARETLLAEAQRVWQETLSEFADQSGPDNGTGGARPTAPPAVQPPPLPQQPSALPSITSAETTQPDVQTILEALRQANPGTMISVRELRRLLRDRLADKARFDAAVLRLAQERRIDLHQHDLPASLTEQQRAEELVADGQGNYFNGIVLRP